MAGSVNKVILIGNLGRDPEVRTFQNGGRVASFSVATNDRWTDRNSGERREKTEWHRVAVLNENLVGICERYLRKGAKVYIEGQLETRKWQDQSGQERFTTEVVVRPYRGEMTMLDARSDGAAAAVAPEGVPTRMTMVRPTPAMAAISAEGRPLAEVCHRGTEAAVDPMHRAVILTTRYPFNKWQNPV